MLFTKATFIGVDPTAGRTPIVYAAVDRDLRLVALGGGQLGEVIAFIAGQQQAFVAVNAPRRPGMQLMTQEAVRARFPSPPRPGRWETYRVAEYVLNLHGIKMPRTPSPLKSPRWMKMGFEIFRRLDELGYTAFPTQSPLQSLEVYPHAAFSVLLDRQPFPKKTLEGRLQRQLILYARDFDVPNPMDIFEEITRHHLLQGLLPLDRLYSSNELDALVAAYTACLAATRPGSICQVGDPVEGQIVLPVNKLRNSY